MVRNSSEVAAGDAGPGRSPATKIARSRASMVSITTGTPILKSLDAARSAGTLEMHPALAQGLESACPGFGQHGCESAGWETMVAHATGTKPSTRTKATAEIARCNFSVALAWFGISSGNITRSEPKAD